MKRILPLLPLAILLLAGCHGNNNDNKTATPAAIDYTAVQTPPFDADSA